MCLLHERKNVYGVHSDSYLDVLADPSCSLPHLISENKSLTCPVKVARENQDWRALHALFMAGYAAAGAVSQAIGQG